MTPGTLKTWRFFVPAALAVSFACLFGYITGLWKFTLPDFSKAPYLVEMVVPAALYYITPLRSLINQPHHRKITERLRSRMVQISGYPDKLDKYTWKNLRPLFFSLIDGDDSLKNKAELAYNNGLIWTSFADSTALGLLYFVFSVIGYFIGIQHAVLSAIIFSVIAIVSFYGSLITTKKQIEIGEEQLEIIEMKYRSDIEKRLNQLDN